MVQAVSGVGKDGLDISSLQDLHHANREYLRRRALHTETPLDPLLEGLRNLRQSFQTPLLTPEQVEQVGNSLAEKLGSVCARSGYSNVNPIILDICALGVFVELVSQRVLSPNSHHSLVPEIAKAIAPEDFARAVALHYVTREGEIREDVNVVVTS